MQYSKVVKVSDEGLEFNCGAKLYSHHESDCCEHHWLDFEHLKIEDFDGLEFDLSSNKFFERVPEYGIKLRPVNGSSISIPGYGSNNGYYSSQLDLILERSKEKVTYSIDDCQKWDFRA